MHRALIILLAGIAAGNAFPQSFTEIDSSTYARYLEGDWDRLVYEGKQAIRKDVDYYYLRMRIGIAYFERQNYRAAAGHFNKALEFSGGDPVALEYLYYSYLYSGQTARAGILKKSFTGILEDKLPPEDSKFIESVSAEYLYSRVQNDDLAEGAEDYFGDYSYGYQVITRNYHNASFSLQQRVGPGISVIQAYTRLNKTDFLYYHDGLTVTTVDGRKVSQHQYYLSPSFSLGSGFTASPSFHYLGIRYQVISEGGNGFGSQSQVSMTERHASDFAGGLALKQTAGPLDIALGGYYSNLNGADQILLRSGFTLFPGGNLNLYLGTYLNTQVEVTEKGTGRRMIPEYLLGAGIASRLWLEVSGAHGEMRNYLEGNGYVVYNGPEEMKHKVSAILVYPFLGQGSRISLGVRWVQYRSRFVPLDTEGGALINPLTYNSFSVFGGVLWKI